MKRLILLFMFVYGVGLLSVAGWHLARAEEDKPVTAWIIFNDYDKYGGMSIYRVRLDGSQNKRLFSSSWVYNLRVSFNGKWILFETHQNGTPAIYRMRVNGTQLKKLSDVTETYFTSFTPDNQWVYFAEYTGGFYRVNLDGSQKQLLAPGLENFGTPQFTQDGQWIIFSATDSDNYDIYKMRLDGSQLQNLSHSLENEYDPQLSLDEQWIVFVEENYRKISRMRWDGSDVENLASGLAPDTMPLFSSDGQWIIFQSTQDENYDIYKMQLDGSHLQNLTNTQEDEYLRTLTLDGQWILFTAYPLNSFYNTLFRMQLDGSASQQLSQNLDIVTLKLTPDEKWIIFNAGDQNGWMGFYRMHLDGSSLQKLTANRAEIYGMPIISWRLIPLIEMPSHREALAGVGAALMLGAVLVGRRGK